MDDIDVDLVVSRHPGLIDYLLDQEVIDEEVPRISHASEEDVRDAVVVGNLPSRLAAEADLLIEVDLEYPEDYRGEELDGSEVAEYASGISAYRVERVQ